jgi:hypothetical protein
VSNQNISEKEELKSDVESLKYIDGCKLTLYKHQFPKLEEIKMYSPSDDVLGHEIEFEISEENYWEKDYENTRTLALDHKILTPRIFITGSGINTIEFKTAINTYLSGGNERSEKRFGQLERSMRR